MSGGHFGSHFADGHFASHFGPTGEANPNAMRGTAAGVASVTGRLTAGEEVAPVQIMGGWLSDEDRKRRRRERRKWREDQDEIRAALKSIYAKIKGTGKDAKPAIEAVKEALKADPVHAAKAVGRVIRALGKVSHVPGVLEVQVDVRAFQRRLAEIDAERRAMAERHRIEMQDEEDLITMLLTGT